MEGYADYEEIDKFLRKCQPSKSPKEATEFLLKLMTSGHVYSTSKYRTCLYYFIKNNFEELVEENDIESIKEMLEFKFPFGSIDGECMEEILKAIMLLIKQNKSLLSVEISLSVILNDSFKEFFKINLKKYCKLIGKSLEVYNLHNSMKNSQIIDIIINELYYFARTPEFRGVFLEYTLENLHKAVTSEAIESENISKMWELINTVLFKRSHLNDEEFDSSIQLFYKEVEKFHSAVLIEAFLIHFKNNSGKIAKFVKNYIVSTLTSDTEVDDDFFNRTQVLFNLLKKYKIEAADLKSADSLIFNEISNKIIQSELAIKKSDLGKYYEVLSLLLDNDPHYFSNNVYNIIVDNMLRKKPANMVEFQELLSTILKIFGKDIYQFLKKLIAALNTKLKDNHKLLKHRKRKLNYEEEESPAIKKSKLIDGSTKCENFDEFGDFNVWPLKVEEIIDEIFANINVNQTIKLWQFFNNELEKLIDDITSSVDENNLFKLGFIASLFCQLFKSSRIHEQLVYKSTEISQIIEEFNAIQHKFYDTIINIEYNNQIMNAFLKISYDYENFLLLYFYHHDESIKSEIDSVFIAENTRIKSSEWKIIQQRIKNFGKKEEKYYSNLLMIQHLLKCNFYNIAETEDDKNFLENFVLDSEQLNLLLNRKNTRFLIFNILNSESSIISLAEYFCSHLSDEETQIKFVLGIVRNNPKMLECFVKSILEVDITDSNYAKIVSILDHLPISLLPVEIKKMIVEKFLQSNIINDETIDHNILIGIIDKLVKNESYRGFFKDFSLKSITKKIRDVKKYERLYDSLIRNSFKKMTSEGMKCFELILDESSKVNLLVICAKVVSEINILPTSECSAEMITKLKVDLITRLLSQFNEENIVEKQNLFYTFSKLCGQNMQHLSDTMKQQHMTLLSGGLLKSINKSQISDECATLFIMTLKDAKKLNLNDEIKGEIVKVLTKYLKELMTEKFSQCNCDNFKREREVIDSLSTYKNNFREMIAEFMLTLLNERNLSEIVTKQKVYVFRICEILFEVCEKPGQKHNLKIRNYTLLCDKLVFMQQITDVDLLCAIINANTAMLKCSKENLEICVIDRVLTFYMDTHNRPCSQSYVDFCKFNESVGQLLFVTANNHHKYFRSRIPQFFKAYTTYLNEIYFYKADTKKDFEPKEISMLLRLTLQLENIMKMLMKLHCISFVIIAPYIMSSITNVFVKNPKMLSVGDKFKMNIKNISYQILSTFDDRARKHVYAASDELARDVYENLFAELKRRG